MHVSSMQSCCRMACMSSWRYYETVLRATEQVAQTFAEKQEEEDFHPQLEADSRRYKNSL